MSRPRQKQPKRVNIHKACARVLRVGRRLVSRPGNKKPKRVNIHVVPWVKTIRSWYVVVDGKNLSSSPSQTKAVRRAREHAGEVPRAELFIHGKNGVVRERATFPRSSDPRRTKG